MHIPYGLIILLFVVSVTAKAQNNNTLQIEDLKREVLTLRRDVDNIQLNLNTSRKRFKRGILVATIGYTITITGGLMLGRKNDDLGKALLISGGTIGGVGTVLLIDSFKFLGRARKE